MSKFEQLREDAMPTVAVAPRRVAPAPTGPMRPANITVGDPVQVSASGFKDPRVTSIKNGVVTVSDANGRKAGFWARDLDWVNGAWMALKDAMYQQRSGTRPITVPMEPSVIGVG